MKTLLITVFTPVIGFSLLFGLVCLFTPLFLVGILAVWFIQRERQKKAVSSLYGPVNA